VNVFAESQVEIVNALRERYKVTFAMHSEYDDGVALVYMIYDRDEEDVFLHCYFHKAQVKRGSSDSPPCGCLRDVAALRRSIFRDHSE
jgi:hypothetical protein